MSGITYNGTNTFNTIIEDIKRTLHNFIEYPSNDTASDLYSEFGSLPNKYEGYKYYNEDAERINELREYTSMLFQLFAEYFKKFIEEGLRIDREVRK